MKDIETLVRDSLHYDGDLQPLASQPLIRRARRRRLVRRAGTGLAVSGLAVATFAAWASWPQPATQVVAVQPAPSPRPAPKTTDDVVLLGATDRVTTEGGAVIVVTPDELCVGNTHEKPSCLIGVDPTLDNPSSGMGWWTTSPQDFVYAWLTPKGTTQATLQVEDDAPQEATLYQIEGREMRIAIITGITCWASDKSAEQVSTDAAGELIYTHISQGGTCPDSLPPATP